MHELDRPGTNMEHSRRKLRWGVLKNKILGGDRAVIGQSISIGIKLDDKHPMG